MEIWRSPENRKRSREKSELGGLYRQDQWAGLQSVVMVYRQRYLSLWANRRNPVVLDFPAL